MRKGSAKMRQWVLVLFLFLGTSAVLGRNPALARPAYHLGAPQVRAMTHRLPISFEINRGQMNPEARFLAHGPGYTLFLTARESVMSLRDSASHDGSSAGSILRLRYLGANRHPRMVGLDRLPGTVNYFTGNDPKGWRLAIPTYGRVEYRNIYPGIDLVYYGQAGHLEYDWVLRPGADLHAIKLAVSGAKRMRIDQRGSLMLGTATGVVQQDRPVIYQIAHGKQALAGRYALRGSRGFGFQVGAYDHSKPLIIDPTLQYATYLGGNLSNGHANSIAVDPSGDAYITGDAYDTDFPTTAGVLQRANQGNSDAYVVKLNPSGTQALYSTYLGGSGDDAGTGVAIDAAGNAYVTGWTSSTNFPTSAPLIGTSNGATDAFLAKLNAQGTALSYSTYLGGPVGAPGNSAGAGIAISGTGGTGAACTAQCAAYLIGTTTSPYYPAPTSVQSFNGLQDAFVTAVNPAGSALLWGSYLGGGGAAGSDLTFGHGIAVDGAGNAYVVGATTSNGLPICPNAAGTAPCTTAGTPIQPANKGRYDGFAAELSYSAGTSKLSLAYSTYLGGSGDDSAEGIALDGARNAYVVGTTRSADYPVTAGVLQSINAGNTDAFVTKLSAAGTAISYSTYFGGTGNDAGNAIAVDSTGRAIITGSTNSSDLATCPGATPLCQSTGTAIQASSGGANDAFVASLTGTANSLVFSTYLGGGNDDIGNGIALDGANKAYITGSTASSGNAAVAGTHPFPTCPGAVPPCATAGSPFQASGPNGGDGFVAQINPGSQIKVAPTEARVARFTAGRHGSTIVFHWRMAVANGVTGFTLFANKHRLNTQVIAVHASLSYQYRAPWAKPARFTLHILLSSGKQLIVPAR